MKLAIAGVGNNTSALVQGIELYRSMSGELLPGVARPSLGGIQVTDVEVVATFDTSPIKVGKPLSQAVFASPNNYPDLGMLRPGGEAAVSTGIGDPANADELSKVTAMLQERNAEVLLYSLPTGLPAMARAYCEAAIAAGVAVVNCTPDPIAGADDLLAAATEQGVPLVGDDLQSQMGSSVVHGALLALFEQRGVTVIGSYQMNCGGNADFDNLRRAGAGKERSKHNALRQKVGDTQNVTVVPSAAFVPYLEDRKVAHMSIEARGWANRPVRLDIHLQVQDSSNAAGVIIDLVRIAAIARRRGEGGFPVAATPLLKSAPIVEDPRCQADLAEERLAALTDAEA